MQNKRLLFTFFILVITKISLAQDPAVIFNYIHKYKEIAISEMKRTGVPAAIKLAQGIHETEAGQSNLVLRSNNHFGIKCKSDWTGSSVKHTDDARNECFRRYNSPEDSYKDHSDFLRNSPRYSALFQLDPTDFESWAYGLKRAGYATNSRYPEIIIKLIRDYNLQDYTLIALGKMPEEGNQWLVNNEIKTEPDVIAVVTKEIVPIQTVTVNYPPGEFKINETRVIYAKKGTSFLSIAQQYNIPLARIFEFNDDMPGEETVKFDQLIYIQRKRKTGNNEFHIVQAGETIYDIAQTEAIRLGSLLENNFLKETMDPAVGEKLYLRTKAPSMPLLAKRPGKTTQQMQNDLAIAKPVIKNPNPGFASEYITHTVQPKEGLFTIAKKYDVSVSDLASWNQLQGNDLKIGQQLKIYIKP